MKKLRSDRARKGATPVNSSLSYGKKEYIIGKLILGVILLV
jgi:hypothetical protein